MDLTFNIPTGHFQRSKIIRKYNPDVLFSVVFDDVVPLTDCHDGEVHFNYKGKSISKYSTISEIMPIESEIKVVNKVLVKIYTDHDKFVIVKINRHIPWAVTFGQFLTAIGHGFFWSEGISFYYVEQDIILQPGETPKYNDVRSEDTTILLQYIKTFPVQIPEGAIQSIPTGSTSFSLDEVSTVIYNEDRSMGAKVSSLAITLIDFSTQRQKIFRDATFVVGIWVSKSLFLYVSSVHELRYLLISGEEGALRKVDKSVVEILKIYTYEHHWILCCMTTRKRIVHLWVDSVEPHFKLAVFMNDYAVAKKLMPHVGGKFIKKFLGI